MDGSKKSFPRRQDEGDGMSVVETETVVFEALQQQLGGAVPSWVQARREQGMARFAAMGLPSPKQEAWKYTNVSRIEKTRFSLAADLDPEISPSDLKPATIQRDAAAELVFVNGHYSERLSIVRDLPASARVVDLRDALVDPIVEANLGRLASSESHPFVALNEAFLRDGAFISIPDGVSIEKPIHLLFLSTAEGEPILSSPRILVVAGSNSRLTLVESWKGLGGTSFNNVVVEIKAGDNAIIDHYKLQQEAPSSFHIAVTHQVQGRSSSYFNHLFTTGGGMARNEIHSVLDGEGGESLLDGLYLLDGDQHLDNQTLIDHAKPHCTSRELYKGILDGTSRGVFEGRIIVRPDAQKTNAKQTNNNLILSREAIANSTPQLEIYADDVKCAHGSTIGRLDETAMFYLRSRGLDERQARDILTWGFASEIVTRVRVAAIRERLEQYLLTRLPVPEKKEVS